MNKFILLFVLCAICLVAGNKSVCPCSKAIDISNTWWLSEGTSGNAFGPYAFVKETGPYLTSSTTYKIIPTSFGLGTYVGKAQITSIEGFGGVGYPRPPGQGFGILNVTVNSAACYEYNGFTHILTNVEKTLIVIPEPNFTSNIATLNYVADFTFNQDCQIAGMREFINTLCTICLFNQIPGVCDGCPITYIAPHCN